MIETIYHGHSFIEIKSTDFVILIDPYYQGETTFDINDFNNVGEKYIVLTHGHSDHIGNAKEICINSQNVKLIGTFELINFFRKKYLLQNTHAMHIGGEYDFGKFKIKLVYALHGGEISNDGCGIYTHPCGVVVRINGKNIYHAGDTGLTYEMKLLGDYDNLDLAFVPIGGNFTMGIDDAVIACKFIKSKIVVPMHYDTWEIIKSNAADFAKKILIENISTPKILNSGQHIIL